MSINVLKLDNQKFWIFYPATVLIICGIIVHDVNCVPVNVALNKPIKAYYTCGAFERESYTTLTDAYSAVSNRPKRSCSYAPANATGVKATFPAEAMVDGVSTTWWQSTSRFRSYEYGTVLFNERSMELEAMINIDLCQEFLASKITIQNGDALTPQRMAIEKSTDGNTYTPWIYAVSLPDWCGTIFPSAYKTVPSSVTDTICVDYVADDKPPGDAITVDLSEVPIALKEWQRIRYLNVKFYDMMFVYPFNSLANSYNHYAVTELSVFAECPCNGQQSGCEISNTTGMYECICGGNTKGMFCESCLPLFNQYQFKYGEPCVACNCFGHASSCFYQASVEAGNFSLDSEGKRRGGGVCVDCQNFTAGVNCEKCVALYYRPSGRIQTAGDACVPCLCNASGSDLNPATGLVDCVMSDDVAAEGKKPGDCYCKANVMGSKCDTCKQGFYNLQSSNPQGCSSCACHTPGTVDGNGLCTPDSAGQCPCKVNVQGRACDTCKDGFYNLSSSNAAGCSPCECNIGGSLNNVCDKVTGQCVCHSDNILGRQCDSIKPGFYYPSPHSIFTELEDSLGEVVYNRNPSNAGFSGRGYAVAVPGSNLTFLLTTPANLDLTYNFILIITYRSSEVSTLTLHFQTADDQDHNVTMETPVCSTAWCELSSPAPIALYPGPNLITLTNNDAEVLLDKIVAVPQEFQNVSSLVTYDLPAGCNFFKNQLPTSPPDLALCQKALFTVTMYYWEAPLPCNCDVTGSFDSTCNMTGGQCKCQTGVVGRTCNKCSPTYYRFSNTGCTDCKCDVLSSACDSVTGQCQCPDNTLGRQCEFCLPNNWNWTKTVGCTPCACHPTGSLSLQCNSTTGVCLCKTGYRGSKCESCLDGFYRDARQECVPCSCDEAGSLTSVCNQTTGQCSCKENTVGRACNTCKTGTFGLSASNSRGCLSCVCMGVTSDCTAANIKLNPAIFPLTVRTDSGEASAIKLSTENGTVYDMNITLDTRQSLSQPMVSLTEAQPRLYWQMPSLLLSNLLSLYGSDVTFTVDYIIVSGQRILDLKVILIDSSGNTLTQTVTNFTPGVDTTHRIVLRESSWSKSSGNLTRGEFLKCLYTAKVLLVPASFATGKHTSRLSKLEFSSVSDVGLVNPYVELCACGPQYTGRSCESCAVGYKRANATSSEYFGVCVPCDCNNHSNTCNPDTGVCLDCQHNTAGNSCETCKHGYYPHATNGCTQCPCYYPRVKNETCHTDNTTGSIVCDSCNVGYTGDLCDKCEPLYYGNPIDVNGTCSLCTCNGNSKTCNNVTGICDSCSNNTAGDHCEVCAVGFYGNASLQTCQECQCKTSMSNSTVCDNISGQCPCFYGVGGRTCDQCLLGYWGNNIQNNTGCQFCGCLEAGSLNSQCDNTTGQCSCRNYTTGTYCNQCVEGYYGLPTLPCQACGCNVTGSVPGSGCNKTTGQCQCQPGVGGRQCDQCLPLYVNFTSAGCQECGPCQRSLGQDIQLLSGAANSVLNKTMLALNVQLEDPTLQVLTAKLNQSLNLLGLAGSNKSSITEVISSVDGQRSLLENGTQILELKVSSLVNSTSTSKNRSEMEVSRFSALKDQATNLSSDSAAVDQLLSKNLGVFDAYNQTASLYLSVRGNSTEDLALTFQPELSLAASLLATVQDTSIMANTNNIIYKQATTIANMSATMISLSADLDAKSLAVSNLSSVLDTLDFSTSSVENTLAQANVFKSQADDVNRSVSDVLNIADMKYADMSSNFTAAKKSASNAETIYSANAASVMSWGDNRQFPIGVSNIVTGNLTLRNSLDSTPPLIDKTALAVTQAEVHVTALEISYSEINRTYQNISTLGKAAVQIIDDFNTATQNLDSAVSMIQSADQLVLLIQGNITSELVDRMRAEFEAERNSSETLRNYVMAVDFQTQVLQNGVSTAANRINNELAQWSPAVVELDAMITAAQALNTLYKDSPAAGQLSDAASKLQEAATVVQTAASSAASQDNVLNQKQGDIDTLYNQTDRALDLQKSLEQRLINQDSNLNVFKQNMTSASSLLQATDQTTKDIESKIAVLKKKMEMAEAALAKLRQPVTFDGNLGLQIVNPENNVQRVFDDIVVDLRKPSNFSNGVFFYVDNPSSGAELQLGVANDTLYFEFSTGVQNVRVPSRFAGCDDCWVRLSASRYANVGHLAVTLLSTGGLVSDSVTAPDNSLAREMTLNSALFIGSLPDTKETSKVRDRSFRGCLDNLMYQSQEINLWVTQSSGTSSRTCCQSPPALPPSPTVPGISFSGFGYIKFSPGTLVLSDIMQVSLEFRTFSTSATMLSISSADGRTVYSVLIDSGLVVWVINVDGVQIRLQSQMPYATGRWAQVLTTREQQNLKLSVRYLDDPSSLNVDNYTVTFPLNLTPLNDMSILFGSNTVNLNNRNSIFAGCMRNVSLSSTSTTIRPNFVDNVTYSAGISTSGCYENVVSGLSFTTEMSYAQLQVKDPLQQINKLEMTIVTQEPNAVLLYIYASDSLRFLYLAVFGGNVVLVYRQNETSTVVSANNYISDGQQHTIVLDCTTLRVSVRIDNIVFEDTSQTLSVSYLTFPANVALYLGGVPEGTTLPPQCPVTQSAAGGITKLLINNNPVDLHQSSIISSKDVSLAGVQGTLSATPAPPVATPTPYTCAPAPNPAYLSLSEGILMSGANEINWSGLGANPNLLELFEGMFSLDIDFAIYKADGVILYVADMTNNPTYYFIIYVMNGKFHVAMKTSLNSYDLQVEESFNDAKRYSLTVLKSNDFLAVAGPLKNYINSGASPNITSSLTFPTSSGVFIGNIGPNVLPNSPLPRAFILQQSKVSFAGALYAVKLKTTAEIALPIMSLDRTKFPAIPAAVYYGISLSGVNSYLGLGTYTINTSLTIEVTMTTISESGLLFALFKDGKFVAVDVKSNQLKLHLSPSYPGITTPLTLTLDTSVRLCDGMIHNIKIEIDNSLATLTVDNVSRPSRVIPVSNALLGITDAQFYIAGLPEAVGALGIVTSSSIKSCVMSATLTTGTAEKVTFDPTQYASSSSGTSYSCPH